MFLFNFIPSNLSFAPVINPISHILFIVIDGLLPTNVNIIIPFLTSGRNIHTKSS